MRSNKIKSSLVAIKLTNLFHCSSSLINFIATKLDLFYYFLNLLTLLLPAKFYCFPNFIAFQIFKIFLMIVFIMDPRDPFQTLTICKTRWTKFNLIHQSKFMNRIDITYFYKSLNWMFINFWPIQDQPNFGQYFRFLIKIFLMQDQRNSGQYLRILVENNWITKINGHEVEGGWVETKTWLDIINEWHPGSFAKGN